MIAKYVVSIIKEYKPEVSSWWDVFYGVINSYCNGVIVNVPDPAIPTTDTIDSMLNMILDKPVPEYASIIMEFTDSESDHMFNIINHLYDDDKEFHDKHMQMANPNTMLGTLDAQIIFHNMVTDRFILNNAVIGYIYSTIDPVTRAINCCIQWDFDITKYFDMDAIQFDLRATVANLGNI